MSLCPQDQELLNEWAAHGVPDYESTRAHAARLVVKLWAAYRELDTALGEVTEAHAADLRAAAETASEYEACQRIAYAMAGAIGWETPGDTWVDKAAHLRPHVEALATTRDDRATAPAGGDGVQS